MTNQPVALLGVPWDVHSSERPGAAAGPEALRLALRDPAGSTFAEDGTDLSDPAVLQDLGDLDLSDEPGAFALIRDAAAAHTADGRRLLAIGGDHAVTWPLYAGVAYGRNDIAIVHVDAHPDLYDDYLGDPLSHASPFARIMETGACPRLIQIGIRASNPHLRAQAERFGVETFGPDQLDQALAVLPTGPTYLSIDLDGLDPAFAPGVNHYEPGGLTTREVLRLIDALKGPVIAADVVELCPDRDIQQATAKVTVKLVKEIVAKMRR